MQAFYHSQVWNYLRRTSNFQPEEQESLSHYKCMSSMFDSMSLCHSRVQFFFKKKKIHRQFIYKLPVIKQLLDPGGLASS